MFAINKNQFKADMHLARIFMDYTPYSQMADTREKTGA